MMKRLFSSISMWIFKKTLNLIPRPWLINISYWVRPLLAFYLKGTKVQDPIDGKCFRKFLPYGYQHQRPNVLSPSTLSLERHRLLWCYLQRKTNFFTKPIKLLHIAPEQCFYRRFKKQANLIYTTCDLESPLADVQADLCDLPFQNDEFEVVFCNHVLEHIEDDRRAMSELFRVLKKGGWGIFQVPQDLSKSKTYEDFSITDPKERALHFGQYDHVRIYGQDYFDRLRAVGFKVTPIESGSFLSVEEIDRYRLIASEWLPLVKKSYF